MAAVAELEVYELPMVQLLAEGLVPKALYLLLQGKPTL